jgi:hypothetical protein
VSFQRDDRETWAAERRGIYANFTTERLAWERERGELLNRIKPETKQYVPVRMGDTPEMPAPLPTTTTRLSSRSSSPANCSPNGSPRRN